ELRQAVSIISAYITDDVRQLSFADMLPLFGYYFRGGYYPRGGSQALSDALAGAVTAAGGRVCLRAPVARIQVQDNRAIGIILADGRQIRAGTVISNADPGQTFGRLIDSSVLSERSRTGSIRFRPSNSAFMVYLVLEGNAQLANSTFVVHGDDGVIISRPPFGSERAPEGYSTATLTGLIDVANFRQWDRKAVHYKKLKREAGDRLIAFAARRIPEIAS